MGINTSEGHFKYIQLGIFKIHLETKILASLLLQFKYILNTFILAEKYKKQYH